MTNITNLKTYFSSLPAFEHSIDQARLDKQEGESAYDCEETAGSQILDLPVELLTDSQKSKPLVLQTTPQNSKAVPQFYFEDTDSASAKEAIASYLAKGWKDLRASSLERFLPSDITPANFYKAQQKALRTGLSKASYHMNRSSNVLIFNLSSLDDMTFGQIFNAVVNNKTVLVRYKHHVIRGLKLDSPEYIFLANLFTTAKSERLNAYFKQKDLRNKEFKLSELVSHELTDTKYAIATTLASIWELDSPSSEYDYQLLMATVQTYFNLKIESTRVIYLGDTGDSTFEQVIRLPLPVQELLIPLLSIELGSLELFGNESLLDMECQ